MIDRDLARFLGPGETTPLSKRTIHIGDCLVASTPTVVYTLLGSCVAACLFDPKARIGGMNHILLPGRSDRDAVRDVARFGLDAMELLLEELRREGAERRRLVAKIFGGAHVMRIYDEKDSPGFRNGRFIVDFLVRERIPAVSSDLGGYEARKIYFRTDTGEVFVKRVLPTQAKVAVTEEKRYRRHLLEEIQHAPAARKPRDASGG